MMVIKVIIAPLSTTTIAANDVIKHNLPRRLIFKGTLLGISFLLNLYLFANMEEGEAEKIGGIVWTAISPALIPLSLELFHILFHRAHRTSLAPPLQRPTSTSSAGKISLAPTDSISSCGFV